MNQTHLEFLSSPAWARMLEADLLPWIDSAGDLGDDILEVGPGPGLTTDLLRRRVGKLTAVEVDPILAARLRDRLLGTNVEVLCADASRAGLAADRFSAATCFSVLHHIPTAADQQRLFAELHRILRPGGVFVGADSRDLEIIRAGHVDDIFIPVDPDTLAGRLEEAGFAESTIDIGDYQFRFLARKLRH